LAGLRCSALANATKDKSNLWFLSLPITAPQERCEPRSGPRRGGGQDAGSKERNPGGGSGAEQINPAKRAARQLSERLVVKLRAWTNARCLQP
jgi:hypothetical protein